MDPEVERKLDYAYVNNDADFIRTYLDHSNPVIRRYAADKIEALRLVEELTRRKQEYSIDRNADDSAYLTNWEYVKWKQAQEK